MPSQFKESREKCYGARDKYWHCLESNNEEVTKCKKFRKDFEKMCSNQWVKYFDKQRNYNKFKAELDINNWEMPIDGKKGNKQ